MLFEIFVASFFSGMLGAMGFGSGAVLIIWLTTYMYYSQLQAQGINLMFFIPCAALSLILLSKKVAIDKSHILPLAAGGTAGIVGGHYLLSGIPTEYLSKLFGIFLILLSVKQLFTAKKNKEPLR